jgi:DNA-binding LacI/PurR family transcriptional regulator
MFSVTAPTLADVAREVGVSRTTVSNAYNRPDQLSPQLRDRILAAAAELGYAGPDPVARGLRRGRTGLVGLVYDQPLSYLFTDPAILLVVAGMTSVWDDVGTSVALLPRLQADDGGLAVLSNAAVDGFVSICDDVGDVRLDALAARHLPFVTVDARFSGARCQVVVDDQGGTRAATRHLLALGHRRLGVVALPPGPGAPGGPVAADDPGPFRYAVWADRLAGVREAVEDAGLPWDAVRVVSVPDDQSPRATARQVAGELLDVDDPPTALVCMSDELGAGSIDAALARGIDVPGRLSVVGFDDTPTGLVTTPALTTVHQALAEKGAAAARLLLEGAPERIVRFPTELVVRASTGPPPTHVRA